MSELKMSVSVSINFRNFAFLTQNSCMNFFSFDRIESNLEIPLD